MFRIVVESAELREKNGKKKDGSPFSLRTQEAWAYLGRAHPERIELSIWSDQSAYDVGEYTLDPASFMVNRFQGLELRRNIKLVPTSTGKVKG